MATGIWLGCPAFGLLFFSDKTQENYVPPASGKETYSGAKHTDTWWLATVSTCATVPITDDQMTKYKTCLFPLWNLHCVAKGRGNSDEKGQGLGIKRKPVCFLISLRSHLWTVRLGNVVAVKTALHRGGRSDLNLCIFDQLTGKRAVNQHIPHECYSAENGPLAKTQILNLQWSAVNKSLQECFILISLSLLGNTDFL